MKGCIGCLLYVWAIFLALVAFLAGRPVEAPVGPPTPSPILENRTAINGLIEVDHAIVRELEALQTAVETLQAPTATPEAPTPSPGPTEAPTASPTLPPDWLPFVTPEGRP